MGGDDDPPFAGTDEEHAAASKIQAMKRGKDSRKHAKKKKDKKEKEDERKKNNPKLGEANGGKGKIKVDPSLSGAAAIVTDAPAVVAENSVEFMLKMFGKDGGAYMRKGSQRSCRDLPMCFSFAMVWITMIWLTSYAKEEGDLNSLFYPLDMHGDICGVANDNDNGKHDYTAYPNRYYPYLPNPDVYVCAQACPPKGTAVLPQIEQIMTAETAFDDFVCIPELEQKMGGRDKAFTRGSCDGCTYDDRKKNYEQFACGGDMLPGVPKQCVAGKGFDEKGPCWHPYGETKEVLYQCVPVDAIDNATALLTNMASEMGVDQQHFEDIFELYWVIGACCGIALVLSFCWIIVLDLFAGPLIWMTVYGIVILLPTAGLVFLYYAGAVKVDLDLPPDVREKMALAAENGMSTDLAYSIAVGCFIADAVCIAIFCIFKSRIAMAIGVIEEASDCFLDLKIAILTPLFTFMVQGPIVCFGVYSMLCIASLRVWDDANSVWVYNDDLRTMMAFQGCGILWALYTFSSVQYTTVAGACADWYFSFPDKDTHERKMDAFPIPKSFYRCLRYNFGSMIFGGALITVVVVFKWIATYMIQQVMAQSPENKIIKFLGHALICVVNCIEKLIRFLGKIAYIECAIYGHNFCTGIYMAAKRLIKNIVRFSFLAVFAHLMIFMGKIGTVILSVFISFEIMMLDRADTLPVPVVPLVCCGIVSFLVVTLVMAVYEVAVDTIMICFLEDEEENDAKGKPHFATGELAEFMHATKTLSDAAEEYADDSRELKTKKIRRDDESHETLMNQHEGVKSAANGGTKSRSAKKRRKEKTGDGSNKIENPMEEEEKE